VGEGAKRVRTGVEAEVINEAIEVYKNAKKYQKMSRPDVADGC
jgi:hypothetical protein